METVLENQNLSDEEKFERTKTAKGGTWYDGWQPYCMTCSTMARMRSESYGFRCTHCGNMIGFNLHRLQESPLNRFDDKEGGDIYIKGTEVIRNTKERGVVIVGHTGIGSTTFVDLKNVKDILVIDDIEKHINEQTDIHCMSAFESKKFKDGQSFDVISKVHYEPYADDIKPNEKFYKKFENQRNHKRKNNKHKRR